MKLNKLWAGAFALLSLMACNNDLDNYPVVEASPQSLDATELLNVDLSIRSSEQLRMVYNIGDRGATEGLAMPETDLNIYLVVKRSDTDQLAYTQAKFTKLANVPHARYSGQIKVPSAPSVGASTAPEYHISAILLSEVGKESTPVARVSGDNPAKVDFIRTPHMVKAVIGPDGKKTLDINVPYVSSWTKMNLTTDGTRTEPLSLIFNPQGTLLRIQMQNGTDKDEKIEKLSIATTAATREGSFVFSKSFEPTWSASWGSLTSMQGIRYNLPEVTTLPKMSGTPGKSDWYYIWMMPTTIVDPLTVINMIPEGFTNTPEDNRRIAIAFRTSRKMLPGSLPVVAKLKPSDADADFSDFNNYGEDAFTDEGTEPRVILPLEYVADRNLTQSGDAFVADEKAPVGYFNHKDAMTKFAGKTITINGEKYHLPTSAEWLGVFGEWESVYYDKNAVLTNRPELVEVRGVKRAYTSDYKNVKTPGRAITYALRFKDTENKMLTAYKYTRIGNFDRAAVFTPAEYPYIEVRARHLGAGTSYQLDDIAQESFWSTDTHRDVVRKFPTTGYNKLGTGQPSSPEDIHQRYFRSAYIAANESIGRAFIVMSSFYESHAYDSSHSPEFGFAVRLFKNNVE